MGNARATAAIVNTVTIFAAIYCNIYSRTIIFTASQRLTEQNAQNEKMCRAKVQKQMCNIKNAQVGSKVCN